MQNPWAGSADSRSRSTFKVMGFTPFNLLPAPYLLNPLNDFHETSPKRSFRWDCVQNTWYSYWVSRFMSLFKVMGFTFEVGVYYISPEPFESCSLNFTSQWDGVQKQWLSYQDFKKPWSHFEVMGYFYPLISVWLFLNDLKITQMHPSLRRCAEPLTQLRTVKVELTLKGNGIYPSFLCSLHVFWTLCTIFVKFHSTVILVRRCAEPMTQLRSLKVKVKLRCCGILQRGI